MSESINFDAGMEQALAENGEIVACSAGVSMYPMLRNKRDMIVVETVRRELKKYDVPLYRISTGKLVLHRILEVHPDMYIIRGDNEIVKEYVQPEQVIGVLKAFYRGGKFVDCATNKKYHIYVRLNRWSYFLRYFWKKILRPFLAKIKHMVLGEK